MKVQGGARDIHRVWEGEDYSMKTAVSWRAHGKIEREEKKRELPSAEEHRGQRS